MASSRANTSVSSHYTLHYKPELRRRFQKQRKNVRYNTFKSITWIPTNAIKWKQETFRFWFFAELNLKFYATAVYYSASRALFLLKKEKNISTLHIIVRWSYRNIVKRMSEWANKRMSVVFIWSVCVKWFSFIGRCLFTCF